MKEPNFFKWLCARILRLAQYIGIWFGGFFVLFLIASAIPGTSHVREDGDKYMNESISVICMVVPLIIIILITLIRKYRKQVHESQTEAPLNKEQPTKSVEGIEVVEPEVVGRIDINLSHLHVEEEKSSNNIQDEQLSFDEETKSFIYRNSELIDAAADIIFEISAASVSMIQRRLHLGYLSAAKIIDILKDFGVVSEFNGVTPRKVLISRDEYYRRKTLWQEKNKKQVDSIENAEDVFPKEEDVDAILLSVDLMDGHDFEEWCADLLKKTGYDKASVTKGSGDQGIDIVAVKDGIRYAIQCKCYSSNLGNKPVQEVYAGKEMYDCQVAAVMTNQYFTVGSKKLAEKTRVLLWDREKLKEMIADANTLTFDTKEI